MQQNLIKKIENLENLVVLDTINLSNNYLTKIENLSCCTKLSSVILSHNKIQSSSDIEHLVDCENVSCVDLSHNLIDDPEVLNVFERMKNLVNLKNKVNF
jgi:dynein assembly factor 1